MDEIVLQGMAKWPDVPAVYGWLSLSRRGQWLIKDDPVEHAGLTAFIARNYEHDAAGRWFFQNGPQRVFVALEYTPIVYRASTDADGALTIESHVGATPAALQGAWADENGTLLLDTELGIGVVDDRDLEYIMPALSDGSGGAPCDDALGALLHDVQHGRPADLWLRYGGSKVIIQPLRAREVPRRFGFDPCPAAPGGHPECS